MIKNVNGIDIEMTEQEIFDHLSDQAAIQASLPKAYVLERQAAYPSIFEQIGSIVKTLKYMQANGSDLGADGAALVAAVDAVKQEFPK